jgi:hypothetical protein
MNDTRDLVLRGQLLMKLLRACLNFLLIAFAASPSYAQMECKCHSKQPAMVRMHNKIGFTGCGNCHKKDENLMSKRNEKAPGAEADLAKRKREDKYCIPCHDSQGPARKENQPEKASMGISSSLYCPKDKLKFPAGSKTCSKCGGALLNVDELMERSHSSPSNEICMECHMAEEVRQIKRHTIFNNEKLKKCLDCHTGHNDCGSCHH